MKSKYPIRVEESFLNKTCWNILLSLEQNSEGLNWRKLQKKIDSSDAVMGRALDFLKKSGFVIQEKRLYKKTNKETGYLDEYSFLKRINNIGIDKMFSLNSPAGILFYGISQEELSPKILKLSYEIKDLHDEILKTIYQRRKKSMDNEYLGLLKLVKNIKTKQFLRNNKDEILKSIVGISHNRRFAEASKDDLLFELAIDSNIILSNYYLKDKEHINDLIEDIDFFIFVSNLLKKIDFPYINIIPTINSLPKKEYKELKNIEKIIKLIKFNENLF